jgi:transposase-like protein
MYSSYTFEDGGNIEYRLLIKYFGVMTKEINKYKLTCGTVALLEVKDKYIN